MIESVLLLYLVNILPRMFWALCKHEVMDSTGYLQEAGVIIIISSLWLRKMKPGEAKGLAQGHKHRMQTQQQPQHHWSWPQGYTAYLKLPSSGMAGERGGGHSVTSAAAWGCLRGHVRLGVQVRDRGIWPFWLLRWQPFCHMWAPFSLHLFVQLFNWCPGHLLAVHLVHRSWPLSLCFHIYRQWNNTCEIA